MIQSCYEEQSYLAANLAVEAAQPRLPRASEAIIFEIPADVDAAKRTA